MAPSERVGVKACRPESALGAKETFEFPAEMAEQALQRLTWMAVLVGVGTATHLLIHYLFTQHVAGGFVQFEAIPSAALYPRLFLIIDVPLMLLIIRYSKLSRQTKLDVGLAFEVGGALVISLTQLGFTLAPGSPLVQGSLSLTSIWILVWRMVVPTSSGRSAITVVASAAMVPLSIYIMVDYGGAHIDPVTVGVMNYTTFFVALVAWFASRVIYNMGTAVARERQLGSYRLEVPLGKGGMGEVWKASHRVLKRPAAIKVIRPELLGPSGTAHYEASLRRFEQEAQATANLNSMHTVKLFDYGETDDGAFFYVMELLDGVDLESLVDKYGPLEPERVVYLMHQICHSLAEAHAQGMTHRDVKPANIFLCRLGPDHDFVKVLDFGLVKVSKDTTDLKLTMDGITAGTPAYMAPEVALGGTTNVGPATDMYMLGCVAYFLLTGDLVFAGDSPLSMVSAHLKDTPVPVSQRCELEVPDELERLIMRMLEKDAQDRPQSAWELRQELGALSLERPWTSRRARTWWDRHRPSLPTGGEVVS